MMRQGYAQDDVRHRPEVSRLHTATAAFPVAGELVPGALASIEAEEPQFLPTDE